MALPHNPLPLKNGKEQDPYTMADHQEVIMEMAFGHKDQGKYNATPNPGKRHLEYLNDQVKVTDRKAQRTAEGKA